MRRQSSLRKARRNSDGLASRRYRPGCLTPVPSLSAPGQVFTNNPPVRFEPRYSILSFTDKRSKTRRTERVDVFTSRKMASSFIPGLLRITSKTARSWASVSYGFAWFIWPLSGFIWPLFILSCHFIVPLSGRASTMKRHLVTVTSKPYPRKRKLRRVNGDRHHGERYAPIAA